MHLFIPVGLSFSLCYGVCTVLDFLESLSILFRLYLFIIAMM
jgi:hypothetical protein